MSTLPQSQIWVHCDVLFFSKVQKMGGARGKQRDTATHYSAENSELKILQNKTTRLHLTTAAQVFLPANADVAHQNETHTGRHITTKMQLQQLNL